MGDRLRLVTLATLVVSVFLHIPSAHAQSVDRCVEARVGGQVAYNCLNEAWKQLAAQAHTPLAMNTLTAQSPATQTGTFNRSATAERMGNTFGLSAISQRPPPPVYVSPLTGGFTPR